MSRSLDAIVALQVHGIDPVLLARWALWKLALLAATGVLVTALVRALAGRISAGGELLAGAAMVIIGSAVFALTNAFGLGHSLAWQLLFLATGFGTGYIAARAVLRRRQTSSRSGHPAVEIVLGALVFACVTAATMVVVLMGLEFTSAPV